MLLCGFMNAVQGFDFALALACTLAFAFLCFFATAFWKLLRRRSVSLKLVVLVVTVVLDTSFGVLHVIESRIHEVGAILAWFGRLRVVRNFCLCRRDFPVGPAGH